MFSSYFNTSLFIVTGGVEIIIAIILGFSAEMYDDLWQCLFFKALKVKESEYVN